MLHKTNPLTVLALVLLVSAPACALQNLPLLPPDDQSVHAINGISNTDTDFSDLQFLKGVLKNNRVVLLGEQTHGDGATFEAKVRLVKFLHEEMDYDMITFESGMYDNFKAFAEVKAGNVNDSPLKESVFSIWSDTQEFQSLLEFIHSKAETAQPLLVTGFDCQMNTAYADKFYEEIKTYSSGTLTEQELEVIEQVLVEHSEFISEDKNDSLLFFRACEKVERQLQSLPDFKTNLSAQILQQSLIGWLSMLSWEIDIKNKVDVRVQNPRDLQMARNLIFLSSIYPDKKIIGWGASYHFADRLDELKYTDITRAYVRRLDSLQHNDEPTSLEKELEGAIPMGQILKGYFGDKVYSISFSSLQGEFGMIGTEPTSLQLLTPPEGSIELEMAKVADVGFVNYRYITDDRRFYSSALGNLPILASWHKIFDGHFFIRNSYSPTFPGQQLPKQKLAKSIRQRKPIVAKNMKKLVDIETGQPLSYGSVYLLNSSVGVTSNLDGEFVLNALDSKMSDKVICSSLGYETDTITVAELLRREVIALRQIPLQLPEVEIGGKGLSAREIVKAAERKIRDNYYQGASHQELFYRVKKYEEDSVVFNEEAAVIVFSPEGYKSSTKPVRSLKGAILQFRNTTNNEDNRNPWTGAGSLWLMYTHDLILDKDNVLHRTRYYDLTLDGIVRSEGKRVYAISFDCKRPGAYTTGFGYPSPQSSRGKIYIDVQNFAVVRFETLISRQPYSSKRFKGMKMDPYGHQLVQTYKEYQGKYFLHYSKQAHYGKWINTETGTGNRHIELRELLSTDIAVKNVATPRLSLSNIKSVSVEEDDDFWSRHNFKLDDNAKECYESVGLK